MKNIFLIALNTVKEIQQNRILYALVAVVFFIIVSGLILGPLSLNEQKRLSINFAFTGSHIGLILIAVYFASTLISHEIEKRTIITLFVKPLSRTQFVIGKFLGLSFILLLMLICLTAFMLFVHLIHGHPVTVILFIALWGILLEALILLALAFFFSSFTSSFLVLVYSILTFIIGHSANGIAFFLSSRKDSVVSQSLVSAINYILPNFEKLNWRSHALYQDTLIPGDLLFSSVYATLWIILLLAVTTLIFERKQVV